MADDRLIEICLDLPRLGALSKKVAAVHGTGDPRLLEVRDVFEDAAARLKVMAHASTPAPDAELARDLDRIRELTDAFTPPAQACGSYRSLLEHLEQLEAEARPCLPTMEESPR